MEGDGSSYYAAAIPTVRLTIMNVARRNVGLTALDEHREMDTVYCPR